jgi:hypothetical protein
MRLSGRTLSLLALLLSAASLPAQSNPETPYSFRSSVSVAAGYSNDSNSLILGKSYNRRLVGLEATYSRRLLHTRYFDYHYDFELRPLTFLQDPVSTTTVTVQFTGQPPVGPFTVQNGPIQSRCTSSIFTGTNSGQTLTETQICGTRWTYAGGLSPLGQRINFNSGRRLQPFLFCNAGFLVAPRDIPVDDSSRFNFTFDFGAGFQFFQNHRRAWSVDYSVHHFSNANTGNQNPGVDSQVIRFAYAFSL